MDNFLSSLDALQLALREADAVLEKTRAKFEDEVAHIEEERAAVSRQRQALELEKTALAVAEAAMKKDMYCETCEDRPTSSNNVSAMDSLSSIGTWQGVPVCRLCKNSSNKDSLMICSSEGCSVACHYYCLGLDQCSKAWICPACATLVLNGARDSVRAACKGAPWPDEPLATQLSCGDGQATAPFCAQDLVRDACETCSSGSEALLPIKSILSGPRPHSSPNRRSKVKVVRIDSAEASPVRGDALSASSSRRNRAAPKTLLTHALSQTRKGANLVSEDGSEDLSLNRV